MEDKPPTLADLLKKDIETANSLIKAIRRTTKLQNNADRLIESLIGGNRNAKENYELFAARSSNNPTDLVSKLKLCLRCLLSNVNQDLFNVHLDKNQQSKFIKKIKELEEVAKPLLG